MNLKICKNFIKYFLWIAIVIEPKIYTQYKSLALLYGFGNIILFIYLFILKGGSIMKVDKPLLIWIILRVYLLIIMILNSNITDIDQWGYLSVMVINIYLIIKYAIYKNEFKYFINAGNLLLLLYLFINAYTLLFFKNGIIANQNIYDNGDGNFFFLGIKVAYTTYVFDMLTFSLLKYKIDKKRLNLYIALLLCAFNIFYPRISTGIICMIMITLIMLIQKRTAFRISIIKSVLISIILNFLVIFKEIQKYFADLIINVFHKNLTFTGRTEIWKAGIIEIQNKGMFKFIFGNGIFNEGAFIPIGDYWPAHNMWIQYIFEYGILGTILFVYMVWICDNYRIDRSYVRYMLLSVLFSIFIGTITMLYFAYSHVYFVLFLLYFTKEINEVIKENNK